VIQEVEGGLSPCMSTDFSDPSYVHQMNECRHVRTLPTPSPGCIVGWAFPLALMARPPPRHHPTQSPPFSNPVDFHANLFREQVSKSTLAQWIFIIKNSHICIHEIDRSISSSLSTDSIKFPHWSNKPSYCFYPCAPLLSLGGCWACDSLSSTSRNFKWYP